jgi:hypothetical protein
VRVRAGWQTGRDACRRMHQIALLPAPDLEA